MAASQFELVARMSRIQIDVEDDPPALPPLKFLSPRLEKTCTMGRNQRALPSDDGSSDELPSPRPPSPHPPSSPKGSARDTPPNIRNSAKQRKREALEKIKEARKQHQQEIEKKFLVQKGVNRVLNGLCNDASSGETVCMTREEERRLIKEELARLQGYCPCSVHCNSCT